MASWEALRPFLWHHVIPFSLPWYHQASFLGSCRRLQIMLPKFQSFLFCVGKSLWGAKMAKNTWPKREKSRLITCVNMLEHNSTLPFFAAPLDECGL